jgi:hypothetical protein
MSTKYLQLLKLFFLGVFMSNIRRGQFPLSRNRLQTSTNIYSQITKKSFDSESCDCNFQLVLPLKSPNTVEAFQINFCSQKMSIVE